MNTDDSATPLAIIGIGCLFPGADNLGAYWARIRNRVDAISDVPPSHWQAEDYFHADPKAPDRIYTARGGFLHATPFNPAAFGIAPNSLEATDTAQLLGLVVAQQALADAGYSEERSFDRSRVSVILGVTGTLELVIPLGARLGHPIWRRALHEAGVAENVAEDVVQRIADSYVGWQENSFPGLLGNVVAGRIANRFDLGGTNCVVDAACASSLSALHLACLELSAGRADMVLSGGVDTFNDIFMYMCFSKTPALSPTGDARPFDASADGTILGEGLGMVVLKRLDDARRDGDRVYAILRGLGSSSDGRGNAIYAPRAAGQVEALRKAYRVASVTPDTIELIEAHGTGTRVGDATEVTALTEVYGAAERGGPWCALGSVKSQIGHTKAAAGVAGIIKAVAALHHKVLPPTLKVKQPTEALQSGDSPFYLNTEARPWLPSAGHPRRAGVSAFGFGGSNFHCVLEEANPHKEAIDWDGDTQIVAFTGPDAAQIERQVAEWPTNVEWPEFRARAAQTRRAWDAAAACRLLLVVQRERTDLPRLLDHARSLLNSQGERSAFRSPEGIFYGRGTRAGKLAVLFPGQGAQYPGMLRELACQFPALHDTLAQACQSAAQARDLIDRIYPLIAFSPEDRRANEDALRATDIAQPALGAISLGAWRILEQFGVRADAAAGHSYGELTALCVAGRLKPADFFHLSYLRGRLMADAAGDDGAMLAVQATQETIAEVLGAEKIDLVLANKNAPQQTVLSGRAADIERAAAAFAARQMRSQRLTVSAAFHSPLVAAAAEPFRAALEQVTFHSSTIPVFANSTAEPYPDDSEAARDRLAGQMARPVEFVRAIERLHESGVYTFLEVGPGHRLTGLVSAILQGRDHEALALDSSNGQRSSVYDLACCLAGLAALNHEVRLAAWDTDAPPPETSADSRKATLLVPLCGANYVKPKPKRPDTPATTVLTSPQRQQGRTLAGAAGWQEPVPPAVAIASRPLTNGTPNPTMNGPHNSAVDRAPASPPSDGTALAHALHLTRDSLAALQRMQDQTAQLHRQFLDGQDAAQRTVQFLVEQQQRMLQVSLALPVGSAPILAPASIPARPELPAPIVSNQPVGCAELARPTTPPVTPTVGLASSAHTTTNLAAATRIPVPAAPVSNQRIETVLLEVIAEKTGYPTEMLELDMALDADLGIDSIKRVEILSALQERLPEAPVIKPEHLGTLHNLRQIAAFLAAAETVTSTTAAVAPSTVSTMGEEQVRTVLLEVIAEKTGYPTEMLELDMALDADLGIDSIKRVEILSALQERLPEAPVIKPEHLGTLHNLRQIAAFLAASSNGHAEKSAPAHPQRQIKAPTVEPARPTTSSTIKRSILRAVPLGKASRQTIRLQAGAEICLASDDAELSHGLEQRLRTLGYQPRRVPVAALREWGCPAALGGLVIVASPRQADDAILQHALFGLQYAAPALRAAGRQGGAVLLTVSRLDGAFGLLGLDSERVPLDGGLAGLTKTAGHEWPEVNCKALDLAGDFANADEAAAAIVEEMFLSGPVEVGLARTQLHILERVVEPLTAAAATPFQPGDAIVLSGGARGVTAEVAVALARAFRPTLILLGRTPEPSSEPAWLAALTGEAEIKRELGNRANGNASLKLIGDQYRLVSAQREIRQTLARITTAGGRALYRTVDIRDAAAAATVLTSVCQELGAPIRGIIHGAGVLADARIEDKTFEQFERVYATKVSGLRSLLQAVEPEELRALVLFSSSTGRFGRAGQVDYAIANEVLNKLAQQQARRLPHCRVVSANWGPWDGGMVSPALKKVFEQEGIGLIPLEAGANYLVEELRSSPGGAVEVILLASGASPQLTNGSAPVNGTTSSVAPPRSLPNAFERLLDRAAHPVLESHILDGRPVLPTVLILEWLAHGALHQNPGLQFHGCNDLRILHGVILDNATAPALRVDAGKTVKRDGFFLASVELRSVRFDGREVLHARAEVVLANQLPAAPVAAPVPHVQPYSRTPEEIYQELLFHGPDLHGIEQVEGCSEGGIIAQVRGAPAPAAWIERPLRQRWLADPLVLDCSFQMMVVWSQEQHGAPSLPCHVARYRQYQRAFPPSGARVVVRVTRDSELHALADIDYLDDRGQLIARLEGYECVIDPALRRAFGRQPLTSATAP